MATSWTAPFTWVSAVVSVLQLNEQLRDNTLHLYEHKGDVRAVSPIKVANYTALVTDGLIQCNGTFDVLLQPGSNYGPTFCLIVKNVGASGGPTVVAGAGDTIEGEASVWLPLQGDSLSLTWVGAMWVVT